MRTLYQEQTAEEKIEAITIDDLQAWAHHKAEGAVVGQPELPESCPMACYIREELGIRASVSSIDVILLDHMDEDWKLATVPHTDLIGSVVAWVDGDYIDDIDRDDFLHILDEIEEDRELEAGDQV